MKQLAIVAAVICVCAAVPSFGQPVSATQQVTVTANVAGVFEFVVDGGNSGPQAFNFGTVDAIGTPSVAVGVGAPTVDTVNGSATYPANGAFTWRIRSAPRRAVTVDSTASKVGGLLINALSMSWAISNAAAGSTSNSTLTQLAGTNPLWFTGQVGAGTGGLVPRATGTINLSLQVDDTASLGPTTWTIVFTASGA